MTCIKPFLVLVTLISSLALGCSSNTPATTNSPETVTEVAPTVRQATPALQSAVLTAEQQAALTPDEVITVLREGNARFVSGELTLRDHSKQVRATANGQFPKAAVLSCVDSRVPVEDVFDRGIGDVFVARVAGNFENTDIVGSMEFATKVAGAKLIMVLGHERCGAIKGAVDGVKLGNLTDTLANIQPAIDAFGDYTGDKTSKNDEFVHMVAEENVRITIRDILNESQVLREMVESGELKIVGAMYDLDSGEVSMVSSERPSMVKGAQ